MGRLLNIVKQIGAQDMANCKIHTFYKTLLLLDITTGHYICLLRVLCELSVLCYQKWCIMMETADKYKIERCSLSLSSLDWKY